MIEYRVDIYIEDEFSAKFGNQRLSDDVILFIDDQPYSHWCYQYHLGRNIRFWLQDETFSIIFKLRFG